MSSNSPSPVTRETLIDDLRGCAACAHQRRTDGEAGARVIWMIRRALRACGQPLMPLPDERAEHEHVSVAEAMAAIDAKQEADQQRIAALEQKLARRNIRHGCSSCGEEGCCEERDCGYLWKIAQAEQERDALRAALRAILADSGGCRFCDSGKLRTPNNPAKDHDSTCGYKLAQDALLASTSSRPEVKLGQEWVSKVTQAEGEDISVIGSGSRPTPDKEQA